MATRETGRFRGNLLGGFSRKDVLAYVKTLYNELDQAQVENETLRQRCMELEHALQNSEKAVFGNAHPVSGLTSSMDSTSNFAATLTPGPIPKPELILEPEPTPELELTPEPEPTPVPETILESESTPDPEMLTIESAETISSDTLRQRCAELEALIQELEHTALQNEPSAPNLASNIASALDTGPSFDPLNDPELISVLASEPAPIKLTARPVPEPNPASEPVPAPPLHPTPPAKALKVKVQRK